MSDNQSDDDDLPKLTPNETATAIVEWLSEQKFQGEPLMHAIVCCDYASQRHLIDAIERIIKDGTVYCHGCSVACGADLPIYHMMPVCK